MIAAGLAGVSTFEASMGSLYISLGAKANAFAFIESVMIEVIGITRKTVFRVRATARSTS